MVSWRDDGIVSIANDTHGQLLICVENDRTVGSPGLFFRANPFDYVLPATLCQLFSVILISRALQFLLKRVGTPKFICNVMGGILMGPSFMGHNQLKEYWVYLFPPRQAEFLVMASIIGAAYFMFLIVVKMDITLSLRAAKSTWRLGIIPFLASVGVMSALLHLFHHPPLSSSLQVHVSRTFISFTLSLNLVPVISDALMELNLIATELGQIALSSAMFHDIMQWVVIASQRIVRAQTMFLSVEYLTSFSFFFLFAIFVLRPTMKWIARRTPAGKPVNEFFIIMILLGVLVMGGICEAIGLSYLMGPLIFGLIIPSGPPLGTTLVQKTESLVSDFLLPFFFIFVGLNTDVAAIENWRKVVRFQCILLAGNLAKLLACVLVSLTYKIKPKHGLVLGLILNIKGINELIAFTRMKVLNVLDEQTFSHLVLSVVVMTSIITPLVNLLYKNRPRVKHSSSIHEGRTKTIQCTSINYSEFRIVSCLHKEGNVRGMIALLDACNPVPESPLCVYVIHLIELEGKTTPIILPINYKKDRKFLSMNYPDTNHIMRAFKNYSDNCTGPVTVLPHINVAPYKNMHDAVCNLAQDKLVSFLIVPFYENDNVDLGSHVTTSIRKLNISFQQYAPCTVGILVDRYSILGSSESNLSIHVGIFFIGGPDDRDALALGIRMSNQENMRVSLFRFILVNQKKGGSDGQTTREEDPEEAAVERLLDLSMVEEFKSKKYGNGDVSWREIEVKDGIDVLEAIRGLEGHFDLVIVGKRHEIGSLQDEEMTNFIENAEILGVVGDMLASTEFCTGMVPVLVTQCGGNIIQHDRVATDIASEVSQRGDG